jgi:hypothetical protein
LLARRSYNPRTISLAGVAHSLRVSQRFTDNSFEFSLRAAQTRVNHVAQRVANQIPPQGKKQSESRAEWICAQSIPLVCGELGKGFLLRESPRP